MTTDWRSEGAPPDPTRITATDRGHGNGNGAASAGLQPGTVLLHTYRVVRLINRGGMGEIYQAEHIDQQTQHAIKVILPELVGDESIVTLFLREAEALRKIRHPAIVGYDGLFRDATGRLHLVMEYVEGPSLRDRLAGGPLTPEEIGRLRNRIAAGLAEAHERGIFHRDVSPDNVILEHGRLEAAKVIDFGIAKLADTGMRTVVGDSFAGKMSWASPEQVGLFGGQIDARSDIYSLGLVLAAAARGRALDMGQTMMATIEARKTVPALDGVPPSLVGQIARMLAPDPLDRPQSMRELIAVAPPPAPPPVPVRRTSRPWLWLTAAPLALLAVAGGGWWLASEAGLTQGLFTPSPPPPQPQPPSPSPPPAKAEEPTQPPSPPPPPAKIEGPTAPPPPPPPQPIDAADTPLTGPLPQPTPAALQQIVKLSPDEIFKVGQRFLTERSDADTALALWLQASRGGSGEAAFAIARFYDPATWNQGPHPFTAPNPSKAREYYTLALQRGVAAARAPLDALGPSGTTP
ncbi:protein kinase domain-containing protein [Inquilinus limosus]|uniref:serine/threonine-protein kinase n=1 Tax=Inquilinus limosus TaxID=171674 RepID=UPI003F5CC3B3